MHFRFKPRRNPGSQSQHRSVNRTAVNPNNSEALRTQSIICIYYRTRAEAIALARRSVAFNANDALSHRGLAWALACDGLYGEAKLEIDTALRLDPKLSAGDASITGWIYYVIRDYEQAVKNYEIAAEQRPNSWQGHFGLVISYAQLGRHAEAKTASQDLLRVRPAANVRYFTVWGKHLKQEVLDHWLDGLRKGGLPEWPHDFKGDPANRLSGEEIKATLFGHRLKGTASSGLEYETSISQSGILHRTTANYVLKGEGRIVGNEWCVRSDDIIFGREYCNPIFRNPSG